MNKERKNGRIPGWWIDDMQAVLIPLDKDQPPGSLDKMETGLEEVNEIVNRLGVKIKVDRGSVIITYSQKMAKEANSRLAGRPRAKKYTAGQIREAVAAADTLDAAAEALGISRRTLFRRLKEISEKQPGDEEYI